MAPDVFRRSSRRLKAVGSNYSLTSPIPLKKSRRADVDHIDGVEVYSFEDELQMEYFANLEEPLPRKMNTFRGFDDDDDCVNLIKHYFDRFYENFLAHGIQQVDLLKKKTPKKVKKQSKKARSWSKTLLRDVSKGRRNSGNAEEELGHGDMYTEPSETNGVDGAADSAVKDETIIGKESSDEDVLVDEPALVDGRRAGGEPLAQDDSVEVVDIPIEIITISDNESDDDCMMVSDPTVPIPKPVAVARCCPNCGKYKSAGAARRSESDKDSALGDEILIMTDGDDSMVEADKSLPELNSNSSTNVETGSTVVPEVVEAAPRPAIPKQRPATESRSAAIHQPGPRPSQAKTSAIDRQRNVGAEPSSVSIVPSKPSDWNSRLPRRIKKQKSGPPQLDQNSMVESQPSLIGFSQTTTNTAVEVIPSANQLARADHLKIQTSPSTSTISARATTLVSPSVKSRASVNTQWPKTSLAKNHPSASDPEPSQAATPTKIFKQSTLQTAGAPTPAFGVSAKSSGKPVLSAAPVPRGSPSRNRLPQIDRVSPVKRFPTEDLTHPEPPSPVHPPQNLVPGSVKVRSESGKTIVLKLDEGKSKIIPPQRPSTENPPPLKTFSGCKIPLKVYCKSIKHPNFVHRARENGKQCDDPSMKPAKSYPPASHVKNSLQLKYQETKPPQSKDLRSTCEGIVSSKISQSPIVFRIEPPNCSSGNGSKWFSIVSQSRNVKNAQVLTIVGAPKPQRAGASTTQKPQPFTDLELHKNNSDANDLSVECSAANNTKPSGSTVSKPVIAPVKVFPGPASQVSIPPRSIVTYSGKSQRSEAPVKSNEATKQSESAASNSVMAPVKVTSGPQPVFQVSIPPRCSVSTPRSTQRSEAPVKSNDATATKQGESTSSNSLMAPVKVITSGPQPVLQVSIPPRYSVSTPGSTQRSEAPLKSNDAVATKQIEITSSNSSIAPVKVITSGPQPVFQVSIPPRYNVSTPGSTQRSEAPAFIRIEKPGCVSAPNLPQKSLAFSKDSRPQGCRVLKVFKPARAPLAAASALHHGVKVLRPVSAFGNSKNMSSNLPVVDDVVKSIVRNMVDFVSQKETFPASFPYDSPVEPEALCLTVPCGNERCRLGCVCVSLSKKSVRRVHCKNVECIFGCRCDIRNLAVVQNRHATPLVHRRKQILGSADDSVPEGHVRSSKVVFSRGEEQNHSIAILKAPKAFSSLLDEPSATRPKTPKVGCSRSEATKLCGPRTKPNPTPPNPILTLPLSRVNLPASAPAPRRFFGREKVPIPEQALICLTPGFGYVPLEECSSTKVSVQDPFNSGKVRSFRNVRQATDWLNAIIQGLLSDSRPDLRWLVANNTMIESRQLQRLNMETLKSTKCTPSRNRAICPQ